jgi:hypothetical protein
MIDKQLCVNFNEAQRLKEAGFPQGASYFVWLEYINLGVRCWKLIRDRDEFSKESIPHGSLYIGTYSAPTVSELLVEFKQEVTIQVVKNNFVNNFVVIHALHSEGNKSLPSALARLYVLIEGGMIFQEEK